MGSYILKHTYVFSIVNWGCSIFVREVRFNLAFGKYSVPIIPYEGFAIIRTSWISFMFFIRR